jgi:hypothetical protein
MSHHGMFKSQGSTEFATTSRSLGGSLTRFQLTWWQSVLAMIPLSFSWMQFLN